MNVKKTKVTSASLKQKSENAISLVKATIAQLRSANEEAATLKATNVAKIAEIEKENSEIDELSNGNLRIIENFEKLLT